MTKFGFWGLVSLVLLNSCRPIKTRLTGAELDLVSMYQKGDTIVFRSSQGALDTSYIVEKEVFYPEYVPIEVHNKYLPQEAKVVYVNSKLKQKNKKEELVYISKRQLKDSLRVILNYLNSGYIFLNFNREELQRFEANEVLEISTYHSKADPEQPRSIFFQKKFGIVRYITHDSVVWERFNIPPKQLKD